MAIDCYWKFKSPALHIVTDDLKKNDALFLKKKTVSRPKLSTYFKHALKAVIFQKLKFYHDENQLDIVIILLSDN